MRVGRLADGVLGRYVLDGCFLIIGSDRYREQIRR